ncbi:hypothetical protein [Streptomyces sp. NPDC058614]|uniref:hypothetical protein n=1 Tax=Streptomyces sp. NPDC058614 TaxID=3346557 RepID=UPI00365DDE4B
MNTRWHRISGRRGMVMAGAVAALLASGGIAAAAASTDGSTSKPEGSTVVEVPGAKPDSVEPVEATPVDETPVVVGDDGTTEDLTR